MCANYRPVIDPERLRTFFGVEPIAKLGECPEETWPGYQAPVIAFARGSAAPGSTGINRLGVGLFGLVPYWAKRLEQGRHTYNARSETADALVSFKEVWNRGQRCIVPLEAFYDPCWESGKAVRWRIERKDGAPMGVAGLWSAWTSPEGKRVLSFTMLTVNADGHDVMGRMHRPEDEKRMIAILAPEQYDAWLAAPVPQMRGFLRCWPAEDLWAVPDPRQTGHATENVSQPLLF